MSRNDHGLMVLAQLCPQPNSPRRGMSLFRGEAPRRKAVPYPQGSKRQELPRPGVATSTPGLDGYDDGSIEKFLNNVVSASVMADMSRDAVPTPDQVAVIASLAGSRPPSCGLFPSSSLITRNPASNSITAPFGGPSGEGGGGGGGGSSSSSSSGNGKGAWHPGVAQLGAGMSGSDSVGSSRGTNPPRPRSRGSSGVGGGVGGAPAQGKLQGPGVGNLLLAPSSRGPAAPPSSSIAAAAATAAAVAAGAAVHGQQQQQQQQRGGPGKVSDAALISSLMSRLGMPLSISICLSLSLSGYLSLCLPSSTNCLQLTV